MNMMERKRAAAVSGASSRAQAGPRIYNLFPLLVGQRVGLGRELPRIARMDFDWVYVNPFHATGASGQPLCHQGPVPPRSAVPRRGRGRRAQIRGFVREVREAFGLKVMTDLVINHAARDALLADERPDLFHSDEVGSV